MRSLVRLYKSRNKNKWPNKNNDVITDLGGEVYFPMFFVKYAELGFELKD